MEKELGDLEFGVITQVT